MTKTQNAISPENAMSPARKQPDTETYAGRFAVHIRELRLKKGLSVEELAEKSGIPAPSLYQWEAGNYTPPVERLLNLSKGLGLKSVQKVLPHE